jgi:hypothetical protein
MEFITVLTLSPVEIVLPLASVVTFTMATVFQPPDKELASAQPEAELTKSTAETLEATLLTTLEASVLIAPASQEETA